MEAILIQMLNMSITASWLIIAVIIARLLIRKAPKWISCLLWGLVMIRLVCPFSFESRLSIVPSNEVIPQDIVLSDSPAITNAAPAAGADTALSMVSIATYVWIAGVLVMLAYALISYFRIRKIVSVSVPFENNVRECDGVKSPFILGVIKPVIYIPSGLSGQALEYVLSHEEAHLSRKDHWWKPLSYLVLTAYWFNPLCWVAYVLLSRDIEMACDEKVIRDMDRGRAAEYSQVLLDESCQVRGIRACPLAFGEVSVKQRVKAVLNYKKPAFWVIIAALALCGTLATVLMTDPAEQSSAATNTAEQQIAAEEAEAADEASPAEAEGAADEGTFIMPVDGMVTSVFGYRGGKLHGGIDIAAEEGAPVRAAAGGTVTNAGSEGDYGLCVVIDHGNGKETVYAHNKNLNVSAGDKVSQGDVIANVGETGQAAGPHLHFEIRFDGEAVDPGTVIDFGTEAESAE